MSVRVMAWVWEQELPTTKKMLLLAIADHAGDDGGNAWPSHETLSRKVGVNVRQIRRLLNELKSDGWLEIAVNLGGVLSTPIDRRPNLYRVIMTGRACRPSRERARETAREGAGTPSREGAETPLTIPNTSINHPKVVEPNFSDDVVRLCDLLADLIEENGSTRPSVTSRWLKDMDLIVRRDGKDPEAVEKAIRWSQGDDFWHRNILSPGKLRDRYDQLRLAAKPRHAKSNTDIIEKYL